MGTSCVPVHGYEEFRVAVACYDFRIDFCLSASVLSRYRRRLEAECSATRCMHLRFLKPLGFRCVYGYRYDPGLAARLLRRPPAWVSEAPFPRSGYLYTYAVLGDGRVFAAWRVPPQRGDVADAAREYLDEAYVGHALPPFNCAGAYSHEPPPELVERQARMQRLLLESGERVELHWRRLPIAYAIIAALDWRPTLSLRDLRRASSLLAWMWGREVEMRDAELKHWVRLVTRTYRALSAARVVGRLKPLPSLSAPRVLLELPGLEDYARLAISGSAGSLLASRDKLVTNMVLATPEDTQLLRELVARGAKAHIIARQGTAPLNFTLYNPVKRQWQDTDAKEWIKVLSYLLRR